MAAAAGLQSLHHKVNYGSTNCFSGTNTNNLNMISEDHVGCVDEYEALNVISRGSYGVVYRVRHKKTGEILAVKEEFNGLSTSTLREIQILKSLPSHPSVVGFKEVAADECGRVFVAMEYLETDLKRYMDIREKPFNLCEVKLLMKQLLEGIQFLHEHGVMHRDLKPSNILMNYKKAVQLKICDFGLSRQFGRRRSGSYTPGVVTLWYRAPELLLGAKDYSSAIDMWSVGCIMAELLLKEVLFEGGSELEQIVNIYRILDTPDDLLSRFISAASFSGAPLLTEVGFDLLRNLLDYDPKKRITAKDALDHAWFKEYYGLSIL